jgi:glycosyltransferase involved in cell wall biosynthesis
VDNSRPLVSIVLPTRNGARYLRESLESCLEQTYTKLELLVVDDGSTDETPAILDQYRDSRVVRLRHAQSRGLPEALNTGFAQSHGEYLTWTSDDNIYEPTAIGVMADYLERHPDIGLVYTDYWLIDEDGRIIGEIRASEPDSLIERDCIGACFLYRRVVYETIGDYNPAARPAEDYEYWLRVSRRFTLAPLNQRLYRYRCHGGSLTGRYGWYPAARAGETAKYRLGWIDERRYQSRLAFIDICEAFEAYSRGDFGRVRACGTRALRRNPAYLRNVGVLSILLQAALGPRAAHAVRGAARSLLGKARG